MEANLNSKHGIQNLNCYENHLSQFKLPVFWSAKLHSGQFVISHCSSFFKKKNSFSCFFLLGKATLC